MTEQDFDFSNVPVTSFTTNAKTFWPTEVGHLTPWVIDNLGWFGDLLGMHLTYESKEVPVGDFRVDIVARDERGRKIVIENQFGPTDHRHFAQLVLYACNLEADVAVWLAAGAKSWCGPSFRPEHVHALMVLNERFQGVTEFYGVEVSLESDPVPITKPPEEAGPLLPRMRRVAPPEPQEQ